MNKLEDLNQKNDVRIYSVKDAEFRPFGRIISGYDFSEAIEYMENKTSIPEEGNLYVPSVSDMENTKIAEIISSAFYGHMPVQFGYCNGRNTTMNGFEYHKGSEINVALSDFCLILGHNYDIKDDLTYDPKDSTVFFVEKGCAIELYENTLHLSPLRVTDEGYKTIVVLPKGTNTPLEDKDKIIRKESFERGDKEARLLLQRNKWVISHPEREPLIKQGAHPGVLGENKELKY